MRKVNGLLLEIIFRILMVSYRIILRLASKKRRIGLIRERYMNSPRLSEFNGERWRRILNSIEGPYIMEYLQDDEELYGVFKDLLFDTISIG